jgi:hypothetical protein
LINLFGVYHYDEHNAIVECADFIGGASAGGKLASLPGCREDPSLPRCRRRAPKWPDENGLSERDSLAVSKPNLQLSWGERDELNMLDLIAFATTKRDNYHLPILGDLAYLCFAVTGLPKSLIQKPRWLDGRQQRTAFESHNGRSALAAGTGVHARDRGKTHLQSTAGRPPQSDCGGSAS